MSEEQSYLSYFTPSQMSHEMLEAILVKRHNLAARLVTKITQSALTPTKHQTLLLGPRGMGKSYLVALVYHRVKALPELADKLAIAYFAEEGVERRVPRRPVAGDTQGIGAGSTAACRSVLTRCTVCPPREIENTAGELVRSFVGERTLLILAENLDEIFRGLGDAGQWAFRSFISERPFVTILATTPSLFAGIAEQKSAFYGFFQNIYLEELTVEEATELLEKVAERRDDKPLANFLKTPTAKERVQAVHDLAGGHPRIYLLFAHLLTQETLDELVTPFMRLLDELTPYYQSRDADTLPAAAQNHRIFVQRAGSRSGERNSRAKPDDLANGFWSARQTGRNGVCPQNSGWPRVAVRVARTPAAHGHRTEARTRRTGSSHRRLSPPLVQPPRTSGNALPSPLPTTH